jgi:hypothetical protein
MARLLALASFVAKASVARCSLFFTVLCDIVFVADIVRTGLMNCTYPLSESIVMDSVPKNQRARWKSLESVLQFGYAVTLAVMFSLLLFALYLLSAGASATRPKAYSAR